MKIISQKNKIRRGEIETAHGKISTPVFMPCATVGAVKGISAEELREIGFEIILGNTYHLYLRPGEKLIKKQGGLQKFINWHKPMLTDSGGYQVFSLGSNFSDYNYSFRNIPNNNILRGTPSGSKEDSRSFNGTSLAQITKRGVWFKSHLDGSKHLFTPEKVIDIQLDLGSDIIMPLDYCPSADAGKDEVEKAVDITNQWFERGFKNFFS